MKFELCVAGPEGIRLAVKYGFDRIELCQALESGGLTPSSAFQRMALRSDLEVHVLIRCRPGHFCYTADEKMLMLEEIAEALELGAHGIVIGALTEERSLDTDFLLQVRHRFPDAELTFHRAFDDLSEPAEALEELISLGFKRILTSGGEGTVVEGIPQLKESIRLAAERIEIMAGGGINTDNAAFILDQVKPQALHFSATEPGDGMQSRFDTGLLRVSEEKIFNILQKIKDSLFPDFPDEKKRLDTQQQDE